MSDNMASVIIIVVLFAFIAFSEWNDRRRGR